MDNLGVSRLHAKILQKNGQYFVEDQGSANGIKINGVSVQRSPLYPGDEVMIGKHVGVEFHDTNNPETLTLVREDEIIGVLGLARFMMETFGLFR